MSERRLWWELNSPERFVRIRADSRGLRTDLRAVRGRVTDELRNISGIATGILASFAVAGAGLLKAGVTQAAGFERSLIAFTTFLGSEKKALSLLKELQEFAARTPFTIPGVELSARQLLTTRLTGEEVIPVLKSVGDVAAGIGRGQFGLQRLIQNLVQVLQQAKLTGRELRDFGILGVPLVKELADVLGRDVTEIQSLTQAGDISADHVMQAFKNMSSAGGKFANQMAKDNKTLLGQFSNLVDVLIIIAREFGKEILPIVKSVVKSLISIGGAIRSIIKGNGKLIGSILVSVTAFTALGTVLLVATLAMKLFGITVTQVLIGTGIGALFVLAGLAVGFFIGKIRESASSMKILAEIADNVTRNIRELIAEFRESFPHINELIRALSINFTFFVNIALNSMALMTISFKSSWDIIRLDLKIAIRGMMVDWLRFMAIVGRPVGASGFLKLAKEIEDSIAALAAAQAAAFGKIGFLRAQNQARLDALLGKGAGGRPGGGVGGAAGTGIKPGRFGFEEFGNKIQDALLKRDDLDVERNKLLDDGNVIQQKILGQFGGAGPPAPLGP